MTTAELMEMVQLLDNLGSKFSGNNVTDEAQEWLDQGFTASDASDWCDIGCWDAPTAAEWRDAGNTPAQIKDAAMQLIDENGADEYTDGDPIYAACNNDIKASELIVEE